MSMKDIEEKDLEICRRHGTYTPSMFLIRLYTNDTVEYTLHSDKQYIFLHEYVHYLQDVFTVYGNMNICNYFNRLKYGVNQIYNFGEKTVNLPVSLQKDQIMKSVVESFKYIFGNTSGLNGIPGKARIKSKSISILDKNIKYYVIEENSNEYIVGAKDVMESMAYAIQKGIYGETSSPPFFPYRTIEFLIGALTTKIENTPIYISAICELSLNSSNPACLLIDTLKKIEKENIKINSLDDLVDIFETELKYFDHNGNKFNSMDDLYEYSFKEAKQMIIEPFNVPELQPLIEWINITYTNAFKLKKENKLVITKGLLEKDPVNYYLTELVSTVGCPTVINNSFLPETIYHSHDTNQVVYLNVLNVFFGIIFSGKKSCDFYQGCLYETQNNNNTYEVSAKCYENPWDRAKDKKLCTLAKLFHLWNIGNKEYELTS